MKIQQPGAATNPISVDSHFFCGLRSTLEKVEAVGIRAVAATHKLSEETVAWIALDNPAGSAGNGQANRVVPANVAQELQSIDDGNLGKIRSEIRDHTAISYVLSHKGPFTVFQLVSSRFTQVGKSFEPENLDRLIKLLETEAGYPSSIRVESRAGSAFRLELVLGGVSSGAIYTMSGDEDDCAVIAGRVENMLQASAPQFSWLHRAWIQHLVALGCALCIGAAGATIFARFAGGGWLAVLAAAAGLAFVPLKWTVRQAYPICQFDFGPDKRKRATYKAIVGLAFSAIVIPVTQAALLG